MADLTEAQEKSYWRYNITFTTVLLSRFVPNHLISVLRAGRFSLSSLLGIPLTYNKARQGPGAIFVVESLRTLTS
jgi:uncharacterized membrane protein